MTQREDLLHLLREEGVDELHSWRCNHPGIYGPCTCLADLADAILAAGYNRKLAS